jgi:hypothetical protein
MGPSNDPGEDRIPGSPSRRYEPGRYGWQSLTITPLMYTLLTLVRLDKNGLNLPRMKSR